MTRDERYFIFNNSTRTCRVENLLRRLRWKFPNLPNGLMSILEHSPAIFDACHPEIYSWCTKGSTQRTTSTTQTRQEQGLAGQHPPTTTVPQVSALVPDQPPYRRMFTEILYLANEGFIVEIGANRLTGILDGARRNRARIGNN